MVDRHLDEDMGKLNKELLKMAALTEGAIHKSIEALKNRDEGLANAVIEEDKKIDKLENDIDEYATNLLALRQPKAVDLRLITTIMKINSDLERIGDLAVNISQRALRLIKEPLMKSLIDIPKLSEIAREMVRSSIDALVRMDEELAKSVILSDPEANKIKNAIQDELVDFMVKDGSSAPRAVPLLLVARHLERICDHATNIAEDVIYVIEGYMVKHKKIKR